MASVKIGMADFFTFIKVYTGIPALVGVGYALFAIDAGMDLFFRAVVFGLFAGASRAGSGFCVSLIESGYSATETQAS